MTDLWAGKSAYITSLWDWTPETWGTIGFTAPGRLDTILRITSDPFIVVIYITRSAPKAVAGIAGKIVGFYMVSHITGHRNDFTHPQHHSTSPERWQHSLKATRAFSFLPEHRLDIGAFDPALARRARAVASSAARLNSEQIELLSELPYVEVAVYGRQLRYAASP